MVEFDNDGIADLTVFQNLNLGKRPGYGSAKFAISNRVGQTA